MSRCPFACRRARRRALTSWERDALRQLGEGFSNAEIAERVVIRPRTAEHHLGRTLPRLELKRRALVAAFALSEFRCTRGVERGDLPMKSGWCRGSIALHRKE